MRKHLQIRALGIAAVALAAAIPTHVLASGFMCRGGRRH